MPTAAASALFLLPARTRLAGTWPAQVAQALARSEALPPGEPGLQAQLQRHFALVPRGWPVAALTRSRDAADVASAGWLRADPAWIRPDIQGARLFAVGEGLQLAREDVEALLPALRTLFGDAGMPIDAPVPSRWYLRLPPGAAPPSFPTPEQALGTDLFDTLVGTDPVADAGQRRWRTLASEAQILLHQHPWNARRAECGLPPVNALWFWGGGALPAQVRTTWTSVRSDEVLLRALAMQAGVAPAPPPAGFEPAPGEALLDLRGWRDTDALCAQWLQPALAAMRAGRLGTLRLDFADGAGFLLRPGDRWRFWRRTSSGTAPAAAAAADGAP